MLVWERLIPLTMYWSKLDRQGHAQCDGGGVHSGIVLLSSVVQWWRDERRSSGGLEQMQVGAGACIQHRSAGNG